jgi:NTE family protein
VLSGASTGAMVAAGVCTRTDEELEMLFANTEQLRLDGLKPVGLRKSMQTRAWLDPAQLDAVIRNNVGMFTFAEAHAHSGRELNISVAPVRSRQKPLLLSHLTTPDVWVHSGALASSALPGLFPPVVLEARSRGGGSIPYTSDERWIDGSLYADLPKQRLARLYNVNHFILSQTNPHALPFVRLHGRRGVLPTVASVLTSSARAQGGMAMEVMQRITRPGSSPLRQVAERGLALFGQPYRGDIDVYPRFRMELLRKVAVNPSRDDLATFIREGQKAVWPALARIRDQTRVERVFQSCVAALEARLGC